MRLSDLFKQPSGESAPRPPPAPASPSTTSVGRPAHAPATPAPATSPLADPDYVARLHQQCLDALQTIISTIQREAQVPAEPLFALLEQVIQSFLVGEELWIAQAHLEGGDKPYLVTHPVNVTILALAIGRGVGYSAPRLKELAVKAYLHDIGMVRLAGMIEQPRPLTKAEVEELQKHPVYSAELIERFIPGVGKGVCYAILQEHERVSGGGYPANIHNGEIEEDMRIIGIADVYEALTHTRSWRERVTPRQAIEHMLSPDVKGQFDPVLLRLLVTQVGVYPAGTWVALSTGESGRIVKTNPTSPLRPVVEVLLDAQGSALPDPRRINLVQHPTVFIKEFAGYERVSK